MQARAEHPGGTLKVASIAGRGTTADVNPPLPV
jgi:hypothetical protein